MARTQDVGQRGRTTIDVVLLHFLHFFSPPSHLPGTKKRRGLKCSRAKHASRAALPCGFVLAMSLTDNQTHLFFALSALFPAPPTHPSGTKKAPGIQMQALQTCASRLALRLEPCKARTQDVGQRGRTTIDVVLLHFLHYTHSFLPLLQRTEKAPRHHALARGSLTRN